MEGIGWKTVSSIIENILPIKGLHYDNRNSFACFGAEKELGIWPEVTGNWVASTNKGRPFPTLPTEHVVMQDPTSWYCGAHKRRHCAASHLSQWCFLLEPRILGNGCEPYAPFSIAFSEIVSMPYKEKNTSRGTCWWFSFNWKWEKKIKRAKC